MTMHAAPTLAIMLACLAFGLSVWFQPPVVQVASPSSTTSATTTPVARASTATTTAPSVATADTTTATATTTATRTDTTATETTITTTTTTTPTPLLTTEVFAVFSRHSFDWASSSTPTPITAVTTVAKQLLSASEGDTSSPSLDARDTVAISEARNIVAAAILEDLKALCEPSSSSSSSSSSPVFRCNFNHQDEDFKTTAFHWAQWFGAPALVSYLSDHGASPDILDAVGRKPGNLSFTNFVRNSRMWAQQAGRACELPEVVLPVFDVPAATPEEQAARDAAMKRAEGEVFRLVGEGEPVLIRNVAAWLKTRAGLEASIGNPKAFVEAHGDLTAKVAGIPYADNFNVASTTMTLREYYNAHMAEAVALVADMPADEDPMYLFRGDKSASAEGEELMSAFINEVFPVTGTRLPLICRTDSPGLGVNNVQFYLGNKGSGAPFHIHSDAANLMLSGRKQWWIMPPANATFSRTHIRKWVRTVRPELAPEQVPLECVQEAGDMMYVPFDWGHAAINLADDTFGYTTELVNRRDALMFADNRPCGGEIKAKKAVVAKKVHLKK